MVQEPSKQWDDTNSLAHLQVGRARHMQHTPADRAFARSRVPTAAGPIEVHACTYMRAPGARQRREQSRPSGRWHACRNMTGVWTVGSGVSCAKATCEAGLAESCRDTAELSNRDGADYTISRTMTTCRHTRLEEQLVAKGAFILVLVPRSLVRLTRRRLTVRVCFIPR